MIWIIIEIIETLTSGFDVLCTICRVQVPTQEVRASVDAAYEVACGSQPSRHA